VKNEPVLLIVMLLEMLLFQLHWNWCFWFQLIQQLDAPSIEGMLLTSTAYVNDVGSNSGLLLMVRLRLLRWPFCCFNCSWE
jgi:hypothetical protein